MCNVSLHMEATWEKCATRNYSYYGLLTVRNSEQGHQVKVARVNEMARKFCGQYFNSLPYIQQKIHSYWTSPFQILCNLLTYTKFIQGWEIVPEKCKTVQNLQFRLKELKQTGRSYFINMMSHNLTYSNTNTSQCRQERTWTQHMDEHILSSQTVGICGMTTHHIQSINTQSWMLITVYASWEKGSVLNPLLIH